MCMVNGDQIITLKLLKEMWAGEVAQQVNLLAAKTDGLNLIPSTHMVGKKELTPTSCFLTSTLALWHASTHIQNE